jgi:UDP-N-acetylglucosamine acyltransferase
MSTLIHPTAIIDKKVKFGKNVEVGPYCVIEGDTTIGDNVKISAHACIGFPPQHIKYNGEDTKVIIGKDTTIREFVTIHRGTTLGTGVTTVGERCLLMAYSHIAHDCRVDNDVMMANSSQLAGHCIVESNVKMGGQLAVTQFCRIGKYSFLGTGTIIRKDVPPFIIGKGFDFEVQAMNTKGLQRNNFDAKVIRDIKNIFKIFYLKKLTVEKSFEVMRQEIGETPEVNYFIEFVSSSKIGVYR